MNTIPAALNHDLAIHKEFFVRSFGCFSFRKVLTAILKWVGALSYT